MMALVAGVLMQSCAALLPPPNAEIEWFRDGRPWARDIPVSATADSRVFRRQHADGRTSERVVACTTVQRRAWLVDRAGAASVRLPVALEVGETRTTRDITVRRIAAPADDAIGRGGTWYSVSSPGVTIFGVGRGMGIVEIRTPAPAGGYSILRAVRSEASVVARRDSVAFHEQRRLLLDRILFLERMEYALRDSVATLLNALDSIRILRPDSTRILRPDSVRGGH